MTFRPLALVSALAVTFSAVLISTRAQEKQADAPIRVQTTLVSVPVIVSDPTARVDTFQD
jgi:hypothetical protein